MNEEEIKKIAAQVKKFIQDQDAKEMDNEPDFEPLCRVKDITILEYIEFDFAIENPLENQFAVVEIAFKPDSSSIDKEMEDEPLIYTLNVAYVNLSPPHHKFRIHNMIEDITDADLPSGELVIAISKPENTNISYSYDIKNAEN